MRAAFLTILAASGLMAAAPAAAQDPEIRFQLASVHDSTVTFAIRHDWVRPGLRGIIVDPARQDALMARFEIMRVSRGVATGLIIAEAGEILPTFVAILQQPHRKFYAQRNFWLGTVLGAIVGVLAGSNL